MSYRGGILILTVACIFKISTVSSDGEITTTTTPIITTTVTTTTTAPDKIEYICSKDRVKEISTKHSHLFYEDTSNQPHSVCSLAEASCTSWKNKHTIIIIYNPPHDSNQFVGGKGTVYFELTCNNEGYDETATQSYSATGHTTYTVQSQTPPIPSTRLSLAISGIGKNDGDPVAIGEKMTLTLKGPENYKIFPTVCEAIPTSQKDVDAAKVKIWESCDTKDPAVMTKDWTIAVASTTNHMFGFRFVNSNDVTISCKAHICPTDLDDCAPICYKSTTVPPVQSLSGRRKRNALIKSLSSDERREDSASASFTIVDFLPNTSNKGTLPQILLIANGIWIARLITVNY